MVGDQALELPVFLLERLEPLGVADLEPAVLPLLAIQHLLGHAVPAHEVADLGACVPLMQYGDDLFVRESTLPHWSS